MYRLLLVEDDASIREAFTIILQINNEYDVSYAENGQVALDLCQKNTYDLILLDIMMPIMDGPTFLKEYARLYPNDVVKIIIMSNLSSGSELSIVQDLGVDRSVLKSSLTPQRLLTIVAEAIKEQMEPKQSFDDSITISDETSQDQDDKNPSRDPY
jgi:DNA-binding response OmpR family regulator